ncbi:hypothetical protein COCCADRAFT_111832 [Bipolaris zeicola 26-R-13]|uniref:Uncharacterized protein n=1 Tax=Cochliobolus carbonum (strain 26-R-13) TaxID=930089 RepID=W6XXC7_COCC2|nr:uncharacterized protein COCCADRAFT_111832 [Bipolaris zeicola 26-R-13]EUC27389.1 hypothetical protein COCCADRAFT_111832 [Bipolaris zeicola 26-R-13]
MKLPGESQQQRGILYKSRYHCPKNAEILSKRSDIDNIGPCPLMSVPQSPTTPITPVTSESAKFSYGKIEQDTLTTERMAKQLRRSARLVVLGKTTVASDEQVREMRAGRDGEGTASVEKGQGKFNCKQKTKAAEAAMALVTPTKEVLIETVIPSDIDEYSIGASTLMDRMPWLFQLEPGPT